MTRRCVGYFLNSLRSSKNPTATEDYSTSPAALLVSQRSRYCWSISVPEWLKEVHPDWASWKGIGLVKSIRQVREKIETEERLYISSLAADANKYLLYSREHWRVENNAHWVLDVSFNEDGSLIRNAAENVSVIRKIAMNLIKKYKDQKGVKSSISGLRKASAWSDSIAEGILNCLVT
jgi:predicted transposase YbfD/YdcC